MLMNLDRLFVLSTLIFFVNTPLQNKNTSDYFILKLSSTSNGSHLSIFLAFSFE